MATSKVLKLSMEDVQWAQPDWEIGSKFILLRSTMKEKKNPSFVVNSSPESPNEAINVNVSVSVFWWWRRWGFEKWKRTNNSIEQRGEMSSKILIISLWVNHACELVFQPYFRLFFSDAAPTTRCAFSLAVPAYTGEWNSHYMGIVYEKARDKCVKIKPNHNI